MNFHVKENELGASAAPADFTKQRTEKEEITTTIGKSTGQPVVPLKQLMPFVLRYRARVACALLALFGASLVTLVLPIALRRVVDNGFSESNALLVNQYFVAIILVVLALAVTSALRYYCVSWISERVVVDLRSALFHHLTRLSKSFYEQSRAGEVMSRLTADTTQIQATLGVSSFIALRNVLLLFGSIGLMIYTSATLSVLILFMLPAIVPPLVLFGRRVRVLSRSAQDKLAESSAMAAENLNAMTCVQVFNNEESARLLFDQATEQSFAAVCKRMQARSLLTAIVIFVAAGAVAGILWYGAQSVIAGSLTGGTLAQFVLYAIIAATSMSSLSQIWGEVQLAAGAADRISEILATEPDIRAPEQPVPFPVPVRGKVSFKNVSFAYPARPELLALNKFSLTVEPGETIAIVGPSGGGKSTIFSLLLRLYDPQSGVISLDNRDISMADPTDLRKHMALVAQETVIFSSSLAENIAYGNRDATLDEIKEAAVAAEADEFIRRLPEGYDTRVGERGATLSGGQCQRIAIARAMLRDAPILLLDEATGALDAENESRIQASFDLLMRNRTTLIIAHRLSTVRNADRILVVDKGEIIAQGKHKELLQSCELYSRLARLQLTNAS